MYFIAINDYVIAEYVASTNNILLDWMHKYNEKVLYVHNYIYLHFRVIPSGWQSVTMDPTIIAARQSRIDAMMARLTVIEDGLGNHESRSHVNFLEQFYLDKHI